MEENGKKYVVRDEAPLTKFFTQTPNLVDDADLTAPAVRLYLHLKRVAGEEGICWQGQRELAAHCHLDPATIIRAKRELEKAGFIRIERGMISGHPAHFITIIDIWPQNYDAYKDLGGKGISRSVEKAYHKNNPRRITQEDKYTSNNLPVTEKLQRKMGLKPRAQDIDPDKYIKGKYGNMVRR